MKEGAFEEAVVKVDKAIATMRMVRGEYPVHGQPSMSIRDFVHGLEVLGLIKLEEPRRPFQAGDIVRYSPWPEIRMTVTRSELRGMVQTCWPGADPGLTFPAHQLVLIEAASAAAPPFKPGDVVVLKEDLCPYRRMTVSRLMPDGLIETHWFEFDGKGDRQFARYMSADLMHAPIAPTSPAPTAEDVLGDLRIGGIAMGYGNAGYAIRQLERAGFKIVRG